MASPTARQAATLAARALLGTAISKLCLAGAAVVTSLTMLILIIAMALTANQAAAAAQLSDIATQDIPPVALLAYQQAVTSHGCDGLPWWVLAGIGKVESNHGRYGGSAPLPNGNVTPPILGPVLDGSGTGGNRTPIPIGQWANTWGVTGDYQRAIGPMQFLPATFARYAPSAAATPHNLFDAANAAAALLCDGSITDLGAAIRRYNNSQTYVDEVLHWGALYQQGGGLPSANAEALVQHPNITLTAAARQDLEAGIVDPRLTQLLAKLADTYALQALSFRTGHPRCKVLPNAVNNGPNCSISNHWEGRAVDITAVAVVGQGPVPVSPNNTAARAITEALAVMPTSPLRPDEVGSPWAAYEDYPGHFTNELHQDHLHIGYQQPPSSLVSR